MRRRLANAALFMLASTLSAQAAEPALAPAGALAGLPSKAEGAHIEKIRALGENSWAILGQAAADPKWPTEGVARGRAFSPKMAYAPDLGGAFFCGTGVHGAKRSDGRYMDDLWFYDSNAHRWICLYPGAGPDTKLHLDRNGFEVDEAGEHVPVSYLSHAYYNTTYNPDLRLYHIMWTQCPWWGKAVPQRWEWLDQKYPAVAKREYGNVGPIIGTAKHPLFWDVARGKWDRSFVAGDGPGGRFEGVTEYIPSLKKTFRVHGNQAWFYDYAAGSWTAAGAKGPIGNYEMIGCFDSKRERVYVGHEKQGFCYFDIKTGAWQKVEGEGQPAKLGTSSNTYLGFDSAAGVLVWKQPHGPVCVYDPEANRWTDLGNRWTEQPSKNPYPDIPCPRYHVKYMVWHGFYNAELNAHFFYLAGDSGSSNASFVTYRFKRAPAAGGDGADGKKGG